MESLNSYISDGDSDSSSNVVRKKSCSSSEEVDANCEPITMDMSEESSYEHSDHEDKSNKYEKSDKPKRYYSRSLSPSPPTSMSSSCSSPNRKKSKNSDEKSGRSSSERSRSNSLRRKRYDEDGRKYDNSRRDEYKDRKDDRHRRNDRDKRDNDRHRRDHGDSRYRDDKSRDKHRDRDKEYDLHDKKRHDKKRTYSRSRSRSRSNHRISSHKRKSRSRSRSRSYDRRHKYSPSRNLHSKRKSSPYRSRRSRSRSRSKERSRSYDWKSNSKLKVLEKLGIEIKVPPGGIDISQTGVASSVSTSGSGTALTPQMLLQKTMEQQVEKVKSATGIELPSYYNPIAVNPTKYAEQIQKRRLLWGNKEKTQVSQTKPEENNSVNVALTTAATTTDNKNSGTIWQGATFGGDQDGKMTAKFKRLMGIKNAGQANDNNGKESSKANGSDLIKKQEEMFHSMESQYEVARLATHSHRGLGLGFGTFQPR